MERPKSEKLWFDPFTTSGSESGLSGPQPGSPPTLAELEKRHILSVLDHCKGNRTHAAKVLGVSIRTLRNKLHEYNDVEPAPAAEEDEQTESQM